MFYSCYYKLTIFKRSQKVFSLSLLNIFSYILYSQSQCCLEILQFSCAWKIEYNKKRMKSVVDIKEV